MMLASESSVPDHDLSDGGGLSAVEGPGRGQAPWCGVERLPPGLQLGGEVGDDVGSYHL